MIAALYVETGGAYYGLPDVDPWDEERDARLYAGPWPVVAHPPCARWSILGSCRGYRDGLDGGCFEAALNAVRIYGGVLEHPRYSLAWRTFSLPSPTVGGWTQAFGDLGWTTEVDQRWYGHRVRKPTWLYYVGAEPSVLRWGTGPAGELSSRGGRRGGAGRLTADSIHSMRSRTPVAFRDVLLDMARSVQTVSA